MLHVRLSKVLGKKLLSKLSLIQRMLMLVAGWDAVMTKTVVNCFRKSKILSESQESEIVEDDDPFKELEEKIENLLSIQLDLVLENMDGASFTKVD